MQNIMVIDVPQRVDLIANVLVINDLIVGERE